MPRKNDNLALISLEKVGKQMAGPGIRYFELAKALSRYFKVKLIAPNNDHLIASSDFEVATYDPAKFSTTILESIKDSEYIISQSLRPNLIKEIRKRGKYFIADLYDPYLIEGMEFEKYGDKRKRDASYNMAYSSFMLQIISADHILCSSERQKDLYAGILLDRKTINPSFYGKHQNIDRLISPLPFGLRDEKPISKNKSFLEKKFPGIKPSDKVILWGGGIWNWFDPISVIQAVEKISEKRSDIKLLFLGVKHPDPKIKQMETARKTIEYCENKGLLDKTVFMNHGWTPYEERIEYLFRANVGISTHLNTLETRYSFRTRILDYIWASLPMVVTTGDIMADLVSNHSLGKVVGYEDVEGIRKAILEVVGDKGTFHKNIAAIREDYTWEKLSSNLVNLIKNDLIEHRPVNWYEFNRMTLSFFKAGLKKDK